MSESTSIHITKKVHQGLLHLIATSLVLRDEYGKGWYYHLMAMEGSNSGLATHFGLSNDDLIFDEHHGILWSSKVT